MGKGVWASGAPWICYYMNKGADVDKEPNVNKRVNVKKEADVNKEACVNKETDVKKEANINKKFYVNICMGCVHCKRTNMPLGKRCHCSIFCLRIKMFLTYFMASSYLTMYVLSCNLLNASCGAP